MGGGASDSGGNGEAVAMVIRVQHTLGTQAGLRMGYARVGDGYGQGSALTLDLRNFETDGAMGVWGHGGGRGFDRMAIRVCVKQASMGMLYKSARGLAH